MEMKTGSDSRERILTAATMIAQAHGYNGLNFRALADAVGIKAASIYHHFESKADLGAAVAKRYWEHSAATLDALRAEFPDPIECLSHYPDTFRNALENNNRICLASFMAAEFDGLPAIVTKEVQTFGNVNIAWLDKVVSAGSIVGAKESKQRARAIFAAVAGAQLMARSRGKIALYDELIASYRIVGLLPE